MILVIVFLLLAILAEFQKIASKSIFRDEKKDKEDSKKVAAIIQNEDYLSEYLRLLVNNNSYNIVETGDPRKYKIHIWTNNREVVEADLNVKTYLTYKHKHVELDLTRDVNFDKLLKLKVINDTSLPKIYVDHISKE